MHKRIYISALTLIAAIAAAPITHASERVILANGFTEHCNHHAQVDGRVRLYSSASEDNYIEFAPEQVVSFETVPDPPPAAKPAPESKPASTAKPASAKLNSADMHQILSRAGNQHNLDVDLLASVIKAESGGNAHAVSHAGAQGLMQLMPGTAATLGVHDSFAADQNVQGGSAYLDALLTQFHNNLALALAAYNAGPQAVAKYHGIPPFHETQVYVARVIHEFNLRVMAREAEARSAVAETHGN